jgi:hypothetical protein
VVITANPATIYGIHWKNAGAGTPTITVYDNATTNSGTILFQIPTSAATTGETYILPQPLRALNGVTINATADLTAAGAVYLA